MAEFEYTDAQQAVIQRSLRGSLFLEGAAGTGKTAAGVGRLQYLLESGVSASEILVLVPQRTLGLPYDKLLRDGVLPAGGEVRIATLGSLGRELVDIFWILIAEDAGFKQPAQRPTFLSLETAQYYMARVVTPLIEEKGYFETVTIDRNRLYSQILDNLNKAVVVGFPHTEIAERLKAAWGSDDVQRRIYDEVQDCASRFRSYCLENNLIDFSLQTELLTNYLWQLPHCQHYLTRRYKHLIVDNLEEDIPVTHDVLHDWLEVCDSALLIFDRFASYRRFLGSDEISAYSLREACDEAVVFNTSLVVTPELRAFNLEMGVSLNRNVQATNHANPRGALVTETHRYHTQMLDWTAEQITGLIVNEGVLPQNIVVIAPYLSDALRFSLMNRLEANRIPARSHRPSRSLREEPAARCLLTLAEIAHPVWGIRPTTFDVAYALMIAIQGLDLVRAQLLAQIVYQPRDGKLHPFDQIRPEMQQRITYVIGNRYDTLRGWLQTYLEGEAQPDNNTQPLDHFWSRLFGEVLSQAGFGFHEDFGAAEIAANLVDSARKFRRTILASPNDKALGQEFVEMIQAGILADQYLRSWMLDETNAVLIAPAYTFLMRNEPVEYQFWLNIGGQGWAERLYQPLTQPHVLTRNWMVGRVWTDVDEVETSAEALYRLVSGLIGRCRKRIYLGYSELGEQGVEQRGMLLDAIQRMLRRLAGGIAEEGQRV